MPKPSPKALEALNAIKEGRHNDVTVNMRNRLIAREWVALVDGKYRLTKAGRNALKPAKKREPKPTPAETPKSVEHTIECWQYDKWKRVATFALIADAERYGSQVSAFNPGERWRIYSGDEDDYVLYESGKRYSVINNVQFRQPVISFADTADADTGLMWIVQKRANHRYHEGRFDKWQQWGNELYADQLDAEDAAERAARIDTDAFEYRTAIADAPELDVRVWCQTARLPDAGLFEQLVAQAIPLTDAPLGIRQAQAAAALVVDWGINKEMIRMVANYLEGYDNGSIKN